MRSESSSFGFGAVSLRLLMLSRIEFDETTGDGDLRNGATLFPAAPNLPVHVGTPTVDCLASLRDSLSARTASLAIRDASLSMILCDEDGPRTLSCSKADCRAEFPNKPAIRSFSSLWSSSLPSSYFCNPETPCKFETCKKSSSFFFGTRELLNFVSESPSVNSSCRSFILKNRFCFGSFRILLVNNCLKI
ncbi:hypothetical protein OGAPHI_007151 [Ogataea philodendri]|uniref:Uncharacterized protein n=1 Tax=Ogataea philodendri TaxID=1378263 RepID=A0A9P8NW19_9ASCO|nr:uncharacterized protein OGAPHI_007151 [Ogataea philodendri]KAH3660565.1 hypothetical protein OGAPHI_007151 [Ogataea philodendri]